mmetsp:Transcript_34933/g.73217  ORF Transcript_34933/g.73217 Transcript_34933/m.73217 type:complete len:205 (+) Transcript_34933:179-793(+)
MSTMSSLRFRPFLFVALLYLFVLLLARERCSSCGVSILAMSIMNKSQFTSVSEAYPRPQQGRCSCGVGTWVRSTTSRCPSLSVPKMRKRTASPLRKRRRRSSSCGASIWVTSTTSRSPSPSARSTPTRLARCSSSASTTWIPRRRPTWTPPTAAARTCTCSTTTACGSSPSSSAPMTTTTRSAPSSAPARPAEPADRRAAAGAR